MLTPWGKLERDALGTFTGERLGLVEHCFDVVAVFEALIEAPRFRSMLTHASAGRCLGKAEWNALSFAVYLHDLGKCNAGFQAKSDPASLAHAGHIHEIAGLVGSRSLPPPLGFLRGAREMDRSGFGLLVLASASHHGDPLRRGVLLQDNLPNRMRRHWEPRGSYDPIESLAWFAQTGEEAFGKIQPDVFSWLLDDENGKQDVNPFVHAFAGLVSLADWIGSNPNTDFFPYGGHGDGERLSWSRQRAKSVVDAMTLDPRRLRADLQKRHVTFPELFSGHSPTNVQDVAGRISDVPVTVIEAPTGTGKTEAALWAFARLFEAGKVDGLYFALPMRTAARQIHTRLVKFAEALFPDPANRPNVVMAVPGYIREGGTEAARLPGFEVLWPDGRKDMAHLRWASENSKRFLAATLAAGTVDQALLSVLQTRHAHLRGVALSRSLLVIDEVHASDVYQATLIRELLARHTGLGGHALLLSATLTREAREGFLNPSMCEIPKKPVGALPDPYPLISPLFQDLGPVGPDKHVAVRPEPWMDDPARIAATGLAAANAGARVLIVRNTVAGVLAVQQELERQGDPALLFRVNGKATPHHGRYAAADREVLDAAVEAHFGKGAPGGVGMVLCASQTLEISIDADADFLITDLAPVDVLLQRLGRLHRHDRTDRPAAHRDATAIILAPVERDLSRRIHAKGQGGHGLGGVYPDLLALDLTLAAIETRPVWRTPRDNRVLVESCLDPDTLRQEATKRGGAWQSHRGANVGGDAAKRGAAKANLLSWNVPWNDQDWCGDDGLRAATRLGLGAVRVRFEQPARSALGVDVDEVSIPEWVRLPEEFDPRTRVPVTTASDGALCFSLGGQAFRYGRWGLLVEKRE